MEMLQTWAAQSWLRPKELLDAAGLSEAFELSALVVGIVCAVLGRRWCWRMTKTEMDRRAAMTGEELSGEGWDIR
jgi:hypothetical protein